ncbi:amidohydrolase [Psychromonas sp. B3M02]|uniref:amidohydrolase n=1 Tax=Psychromonas sp. B3M02 TaxID=2267226 RepID=UPI0011BD5873|nr:amidohydrolase [Psychromonas sp. B3M02]
MSSSITTPVPQWLTNLRLPEWLLPTDWPLLNGLPQLAHVEVSAGAVAKLTPILPSDVIESINIDGALCLPSLVEAHAHLDKTFTRHRIGDVTPGLLGAIEAMQQDKSKWSHDDLWQRVEQALQQAYANGVAYLRTHVDWDNEQAPAAWHVLQALAKSWQHKIHLEQVALVPLTLLADSNNTDTILQQVSATGNGIMGCFIHSVNFDADAFEYLIKQAAKLHIDLDLHIDEELADQPQGLICLLDCLETVSFRGRIVCGHVCALSSCETSLATSLLDRIQQQPITLISLPTTNLLLQDAEVDRTPKLLGLTLLKEAKSRDIPTMIATDNVQDAFCSFGEYDPIEALRLATYGAQLSHVFDRWSQSICNANYLSSELNAFNLIGKSADFVVFDNKDVWSWPSGEERLLIRGGYVIKPNKQAVVPLFNDHKDIS